MIVGHNGSQRHCNRRQCAAGIGAGAVAALRGVGINAVAAAERGSGDSGGARRRGRGAV